jgi:formamidopyrimidine-DNA glycosylase
MIDLVEARIIAEQIASHLMGKRIVDAVIVEKKEGSMRDGYLLPVQPEQFQASLQGAALSASYARLRRVTIETDRGTGLAFWEVFGRILYIAPGAKIPGNPPISLVFDDGSRLIVLSGVWGNLKLAPNEELREFRSASIPDILDTSSVDFTIPALADFLHHGDFAKRTIKEILTRYYTPCLISVMGSLNQEALYRAQIHPKRKVKSLSAEEIARLHGAIREVTLEAIAMGGRASERDLFDQPGRFVPTVSQAAEGKPCPKCGQEIQSIKLGGAGKYFICPGCQALKA